VPVTDVSAEQKILYIDQGPLCGSSPTLSRLRLNAINAVITTAIRLRSDYDTTTIQLRRIARAFAFHSTRFDHVNFSS